MNKLTTIALALLLVPNGLPAQTNPAVALEAATAREQTDGDLTTAIAAYQKIAADKSAPRDVRAKALLLLGAAQERAGQSSESAYKQILADFADQPAAAKARKQLALRNPAARANTAGGTTLRKLEIHSGVIAPSVPLLFPASDGQSIIYFDESAAALYRSDLNGANKITLFKAQSDRMPRWFASRDLSSVLIVSRTKPNQPSEWAFVKGDGNGYRKIADVSPKWDPLDWSWDNRLILAVDNAAPKKRLLAISAADGAAREIARLDRAPFSARFAPDGTTIAYSLGNRLSARILVVSASGETEQTVSESGVLLDWTKDGNYLAISLERSGSTALHVFPIAHGRPAGEPTLIRYGSFSSGGSTATGALLYRAVPAGGAVSAAIASLDDTGRAKEWKPLKIVGANGGNPGPAFSPNGRRIVYVSSFDAAGQTSRSVRIRDLATGDDRAIHTVPGVKTCNCLWPDPGSTVLCMVNDRASQTTDLLSISVDSGQVKKLSTLPNMGYGYSLSADGKTLYGVKAPENILARWDLQTGEETLFKKSANEPLRPFTVSPDGHWLIGSSLSNDLGVRPLGGGAWQTLVTGSAFYQTKVTPDSQSIYYHGLDANNGHGLYRVPLKGGQPERMGDFPTKLAVGALAISPDARTILALSFNSMGDLWLLENYVPKH